MRKRQALIYMVGCAMAGAVPAADDAAAWTALAQPGAIVLFRHATAPGVGDPGGFRLDDCATQRNLDESGRSEARQLGETFRRRGVTVGQVLHSRWCRARDTAQLAFPGQARPEPAFDSFFGQPGQAPQQTARARAMLQQWQGPGALVVVTHQVNIQALAGVSMASAEGVVLRATPAGELRVVGRIHP